jgi:hypothetical protein
MEMSETDLNERLVDFGYGPADTPLLSEYLAYYTYPDLSSLDTQLGGRQLQWLALQHDAALVVVDTASKVIEGEENSNDVWRDVFRYSITPLKADGIAVLTLDHFGKDTAKGPRGASAKSDHVDLQWHLAVKGESVSLDHAGVCRLGWVPRVVKLDRRQEPHLHHRWIENAALTNEELDLLALLDELGLPDDIGRPTLKKKVDDAYLTAEQKNIATVADVVWTNVVRYRKARGTVPGTGSLTPIGNCVGLDTAKTTQPSLRTGDGTGANTDAACMGTVPRPLGGNSSPDDFHTEPVDSPPDESGPEETDPNFGAP